MRRPGLKKRVARLRAELEFLLDRTRATWFIGWSGGSARRLRNEAVP